MPENDIENIDSQNDAEINNENVEAEDDNTPTLEDYQAIKEEKEKLEEANKKLYARLKTSSKPLTNKSPDSEIGTKIERLELKTEGYNDEEIDFISQYGGKKSLENPIVKTALDVLREKHKAENAVVDSESSKSSVEKKYTEVQLKNMPIDELEALIKSSS